MASEAEALIVEFDEDRPRTPSQSSRNGIRGDSMEFDINVEIAKRRVSLERSRMRSNPERTRAGIEAYKRDLPSLLGAGEEHRVVVYDGDRKIASAPNLASVMAKLKKDGIKDTASLFIKHVASLDDDAENFQSPTR